MKLDMNLLGSYPDLLNKEQFRIVCHISKRTALFYLQNNLIPHINTGRKTHTYLIRKEDIIAFAEDHEKHPFKYLPPDNWYIYKPPRANPNSGRHLMLGEGFREKARVYYRLLLASEHDLLSVKDIRRITGYNGKTVIRWIHQGKLSLYTAQANRFFIAKAALFDFLCSDFYDTVQQKSAKHAEAIAEIREKFR